MAKLLGENLSTQSHDGEILNENICKVCAEPCEPYNKPGLCCVGGCLKWIHIDCLQRHNIPTSFVGDTFFELNCIDCHPLCKETVSRERMPWLNVIILTLYNLRAKSSGISKKGYFHWKSDISTYVDRFWDYLFKKTFKKKKNWIGTISGTLSHYSGIFFKSGTVELGESGWWRLINDDPPSVLVKRSVKLMTEKKKQISQQGKLNNKTCNSPSPSESSISVGEDSNYGGESVKHQEPSMYSQAYVQPSETLSDFLLEEDELNDIDMLDFEDGIELKNQCDIPLFSSFIKDYQYQINDLKTPQTLEDCSNEWKNVNNSDFINRIGSRKLENDDEDEEGDEDEEDEDNDDEEDDDEDADDDDSDKYTNISYDKKSTPSLFTINRKRPWPWLRPLISGTKVLQINKQEETCLLEEMEKLPLENAPAAVRRLHRKLIVRKIKRDRGLKLFDINTINSNVANDAKKPFQENDRVLDRFCIQDFNSIFEQRLQGYNKPTTVHSPYTNRILKPFIRRDTTSRPLWLRLMKELLIKVNGNNSDCKDSPNDPIDYSYVRPQHIPAINSLCNQYFWPGIDLTECLQYPDFSCVVLYKKLVVGFAFLVPDVGYNEAYISFILTRPEWRKAGIGTFMLYHLIQTCMGKDVTLHVSATNPALILYQKFGFKIEEFIQDFYDKYMPMNSRECRHALFLRLSR